MKSRAKAVGVYIISQCIDSVVSVVGDTHILVGILNPHGESASKGVKVSVRGSRNDAMTSLMLCSMIVYATHAHYNNEDSKLVRDN